MTRVTIWLSFHHHTKHTEAPLLHKMWPISYFHTKKYSCKQKVLLFRFSYFSSFRPPRRPSRRGSLPAPPAAVKGVPRPPRPPRPAPGNSGGMDDAQSRREGPPAHPLRHGRPYLGTTGSGPPGDGKRAFGRGGQGFPPCKSRCRGRRGRKCGS